MSYYPPGTPQSYPQFQAAYPPYPTQFQGQFPSQSPFPTSQPSFNASSSSSPPPDPPSALQLSAVTSDVAAKSIQRLASLELRNAGFDAAEPYALDWLEREVIACLPFISPQPTYYLNMILSLQLSIHYSSLLMIMPIIVIEPVP